MIVWFVKVIMLVLLAVIWTKLKLLDRGLGARLSVSVILFAASIFYEMAIPWVTPMLMESLMNGKLENLKFWVQVIPLPGYILMTLALLNLVPILRDKQFHKI